MTGRTPYPGLNNRQTLEFVEGGQRMTQPNGCPEHLWTITWSCWHEDPMKRPTFESLQNQLEDFVTGQQNQYHSAESQFSQYATRTQAFMTRLHVIYTSKSGLFAKRHNLPSIDCKSDFSDNFDQNQENEIPSKVTLTQNFN